VPVPSPAPGPSYQPESYGYPADQKKTQPAPAPAMPQPQPHTAMVPAAAGALQIHHYVHPETGERIASLLPPDHPAMVCLQEGRHVAVSTYGILGILAAVFWFPLGVGLCLLDRRVKCRRCGQAVSGGLCD
jgi:hypothetical protein